jgi:hypothetical protein
MFGMLTNLAKAAVGVVTAPVAMVADAVTMGGVLTDRPKSYTGDHLKATLDSLQKAIDPE